MSASMVFSKGGLQVHGIGVRFCVWVLVFVPQVLEAVGRKDLRTAAPVLGRPAGADSGLGSAANGFRPTAVRSPTRGPVALLGTGQHAAADPRFRVAHSSPATDYVAGFLWRLGTGAVHCGRLWSDLVFRDGADARDRHSRGTRGGPWRSRRARLARNTLGHAGGPGNRYARRICADTILPDRLDWMERIWNLSLRCLSDRRPDIHMCCCPVGKCCPCGVLGSRATGVTGRSSGRLAL